MATLVHSFSSQVYIECLLRPRGVLDAGDKRKQRQMWSLLSGS